MTKALMLSYIYCRLASYLLVARFSVCLYIFMFCLCNVGGGIITPSNPTPMLYSTICTICSINLLIIRGMEKGSVNLSLDVCTRPRIGSSNR